MVTHTVTDALTALEEIAPLHLAGDWDNVGLLLESQAAGTTPLEKILLCIDLVPAVAREALASGAQLVVAYHPPIFAGIKRLVRSEPRSRSLLDLTAAGVTVFSPHTALDATAGGVNDWLVDGLLPRRSPGDSVRILEPTGGDPTATTGQGRLVQFATPRPLPDLMAMAAAHLGTEALRVALPDGADDPATIESVALCPGAGGSVIGSTPADLLWTGEMRHHDVLAATERGQAVLLAEHTHTERGYLEVLAQRLHTALPGLSTGAIQVSVADRDPLQPYREAYPQD